MKLIHGGFIRKDAMTFIPVHWVLKEMKKKGIPVTLSSDAHQPEEIDGYYAEALKILRDIGFKSLVYLNEGGWKEQAI